MFRFPNPARALLLLLAALSSPASSGFSPTGSATAHRKDVLDPNVRDWGDYSDLIQVEPSRSKEEEHGDKSGGGELSSSLAPELDFLAEFAGEMSAHDRLKGVCWFTEHTTWSSFPGKRRLWVITAPSHTNPYLQMMEKQLEDMEQVHLRSLTANR